jgi:uncharacterized protein (TIGR02646 family)
MKGAEPEELRQWKNDNATVPENLAYGALHGAVTRAIRRQMLTEQGYLCAYTMQRVLTTDDCHIEHIVPQEQPPKSHERDLDYTNMLACFPGNTPPKGWNPKYPYGAQRKGGTHIDATSFVSPLSTDVEGRFHYVADGSIRSDASDAAALNSINILQLNHGVLSELRKAAIEEWVLDALLSAEEAEKLAVTISSPNSSGMLPEFCTAISQVSKWYANAMRSRNKLDALFE